MSEVSKMVTVKRSAWKNITTTFSSIFHQSNFTKNIFEWIYFRQWRFYPKMLIYLYK